MKRVTIKDVAKVAGVSVASVSYAINHVDKIHPETRERILKVIKDLDYKPSQAARCLSNRNSQMIGITFPITESGDTAGTLFNNPFFGEFISGIESVTKRQGYDILFTGVETDEQCKDWIRKRELDGLIMLGMYPKSFFYAVKKQKVPIVLVDTYEEYAKDFHRVLIEDEFGAYKATKYLIECGHKKIAFVTGSIEHSLVNRKRYEGYKCALEEAGMQLNRDYVFEQPVCFEGGYRAAKSIIDEKCDATAVFAVADIMAVGMLKAFQQNGISVPKDISIIGFDDILISQYVTPGLTTMRQNSFEKGRCAAEILMSDIEEELHDTKSILLEPELVERESVCTVKY